MNILPRILALVCLVFVLAGVSYAQDVIADSRISQVMVYPDSSLVTRSVGINVVPGEHKIVLSDIIPELDEDSLRVSVSDSRAVKVLGASVKKEFLKEAASEKIKALEAQIESVRDQVRRLEDDKKVLSEEKAFLDSVRLFSGQQIPKDLITKMPPAAELDGTLKFLSANLKDNYNKVVDAELKIRDAQKNLGVLQRQLNEISGPQQKVKRSIVVEAQVLKAGLAELSVSYLVGGANWQPSYDARADFDSSSVELTSYATITQKTGEDWQDVEVYLSTAKPSAGAGMPPVESWFIRPYEPPRVNRLESRAPRGAYKAMMVADDVAGYSAEESFGAPAPSYSVAEEKGVAVVYKLMRKASIKSDGAENKLPVSAQALKSNFEYSAYPRADLKSYLRSRVTNAKELQLLAGNVSIFLGGDFVGTSTIDNIGPGEEFDLYLGADDNVKVKRELIEKKVDDVIIANIPSPNRKTTFKYKLTAENYKSRKITAKLFEPVPVSENEKIKVNIINISLQPKLKDWENKKGVWLWEFELEPKAKQEVFYTVTVEHPRDLQVEGL